MEIPKTVEIPNEESLSPMMKHYINVKKKYPDCIVFYRLGDFYEMFFNDAVEASKVLEITLTHRDCGNGNKAPMCGIPYHASNTYLVKLVQEGYKVAICEQGEVIPNQPVTRDITRIVTAGTIFEDALLEENKNNYIACVYYINNQAAVSYCDVSTGEFKVVEYKDNTLNKINELLVSICPAEIICNKEIDTIQNQLYCRQTKYVPEFQEYYDWSFNIENADNLLAKQFGSAYKTNFDLKNQMLCISSCGALLDYIIETQKRTLLHLNKITKFNTENFMLLDINTRRNLEIKETIRDRKKKGSLLWLLDNTKTSIGRRLFRTWLDQPLTNATEINLRLGAVEELVDKIVARDYLSSTLVLVNDISRLLGRISFGNFIPKDLIGIKESLQLIPRIKESLSKFNSKKMEFIYNKIQDYSELANLIDSTIDEKAPSNIKDGGIIKFGYSQELDELKSTKANSQKLITDYENAERERTSVKTLKVGYNKVYGYYIELTKAQAGNAPLNYVRKQTTVNNERFITEELKNIENKILNSEANAISLELEIYNYVRQQILNNINSLQDLSNTIAELDCYLSLAIVAVKHNYCKPVINNKINHIKIIDGRHPVVEVLLKKDDFISNDTTLDDNENKIMIITGPNMAGKSTYMRQVAVITFMAHIGSFVPAKSAEIAITDRIFTRVGASDDLAFGQSTFMVEMSEVANILNCATNKSLVILDEIGRGTSTLDGLSIAWSVVEYLSANMKTKTLFSTHYHELTELEGLTPGVKNYKIAVKEINDTIVFLRKILRGGANKSFGIEVASLAGIPSCVTARAKEINKSLEESEKQRSINSSAKEKTEDDMLKVKKYLSVIAQLKDIDVNRLSPLSAFETLVDLVGKIKEEK